MVPQTFDSSGQSGFSTGLDYVAPLPPDIMRTARDADGWSNTHNQCHLGCFRPAGVKQRAPSNHPDFNEPNAYQSSGARLRDFNHASILWRLKRQSLPILKAGSSPRPANLQMVERLTLRKFATSPVVSRSDVGSAVPARGSWDGTARCSRDASLRPPFSSTRFALEFKVANLGSGLAFPKNSWLELALDSSRPSNEVSLLLQI